MQLQWPEGTTDLPGCETLYSATRDGKGNRVTGNVTIFRGPRARIGICFGEAAAAVASNGRSTYPSKLANRAARVASLAGPGQTLASGATVDAAAAEGGAEGPPPAWAWDELGDAELKGVRRPMRVVSVHTPTLQLRPMPALELKRSRSLASDGSASTFAFSPSASETMSMPDTVSEVSLPSMLTDKNDVMQRFLSSSRRDSFPQHPADDDAESTLEGVRSQLQQLVLGLSDAAWHAFVDEEEARRRG